MNCKFCDFDKTKIENTIIEETDNFFVIPAIGSLVDGYILVITKKHLNSMANIIPENYDEYNELLLKYREIFKKIYNKYPITFEHGTPILNSNHKANSIVHAHTHIVNHNFFNEKEVIDNLKFEKIDKLTNINFTKLYSIYE